MKEEGEISAIDETDELCGLEGIVYTPRPKKPEPKTAETLLTRLEVNPDSGELIVGFRNLGIMHIPTWKHEFATRILGRAREDKAEEAYKKIRDKIKSNPELAKYSYSTLDRYWKTMQFQCPIALKEIIPKEFLRGHYTPRARWDLGCKPGDFISVNTAGVAVLEKRQALEEELEGFKEKIGQGRAVSSTSRIFHELDVLFDSYDGKNFQELVERSRTISPLKKLDLRFLEHRRDIADKMQEILKKDGPLRVLYVPVTPSSKDRVLRVEYDKYDFLSKRRGITRRDLERMKWAFLDSEAPKFMRGDFETTDIGADICQDGKIVKRVIFSKSNPGTEEIDGFEIYGGCKDTVADFTDFMMNENPDMWSSYNTAYDFNAFRNSELGFPVGDRKANPIFKSTAAASRRMEIRGAMMFDPMFWARMAMANPNAKLEMSAGFEKEIDYAELERLNDEADAGNSASARKKLEYLASDVAHLSSFYFMDSFWNNLEDACWISEEFKVSFERVMHTARNINDAQERGYFSALGTYREVVPPHFKTTKMQKLENAGKALFMRSTLKEGIKEKGLQGRFTDVSKVYIPIGDFFRDLIAVRFPDVKRFYDYKDQHRGDKKRLYFLEQFATALSTWMIKDDGKYLKEVSILEKLRYENVRAEEFEKAYEDFKENIRKNSEFGIVHLNKGKLSQKSVEKYSPDSAKEFVKKNGLGFEIFTKMVNQRSVVKRAGRNVLGNYGVFPSSDFFTPDKYRDPENIHIIEDVMAEHLGRISEFIKGSGLELICHEGCFLYLKGNKKALLSKDAPVVLVDEIPELYNSDNAYYEKFGYINHWKIQDNPGFKRNVFEMTNLGKTMRSLLRGDEEEAKKQFYDAARQLREGRVTARELMYHNKSMGLFSAYVMNGLGKDGAIVFTTEEDPNKGREDKDKVEIRLDETLGLRYYLQKKEQKSDAEQEETEEPEEARQPEYLLDNEYETAREQKEKRIYIVRIEDLKLNMKVYERKFEKKGRAILEPVFNRKPNEGQLEMQL